MLALLAPQSGHSPNADDLNTLYWVMLVIGLVLLIAINGALVALVMRFRSARGRQPRRLVVRRPAQIGTAGAFAALAIVTFVLGVIQDTQREAGRGIRTGWPPGRGSDSPPSARSTSRPSPPRRRPLEIRACGQQWIWRYEYPDGTYSYYELVVPVDTAVVIDLCSTDVVHRWWVPGLSGKFDATPG